MKLNPEIPKRLQSVEFVLYAVLFVALISLLATYPSYPSIKTFAGAILFLVIWLLFRVSEAKTDTSIIQDTPEDTNQ